MNRSHYCIIMAGGIGSRFWPLSRTKKPKQFLDILGTGRTLLQQTFDRLKKIFPVENIFIVSNEDYNDLILKQLPEIRKNQVLLEPMRRNTAPCIAYANYRIQLEDPNAIVLVAPSDHIILKESEFLDVVKKGLEFVTTNDSLLTLGIQPNRPETGYGYIQINGDRKKAIELNTSIRKVKTFTEKPNLEMAELFLKSGDFYWNSGMFMWSLKSIHKAFELYLPEVDAMFNEGMEFYNTPREAEFISKAYPNCRNISIDYGIMEKADNVFVLCSDFGWSDLGTWGSLYDTLKKNEDNNTISGLNVFTYNTQNCIINVPEEKLVVIHGLDDYIVVESDNILLICRKQDEQKIKNFVNDVKIEKGENFV
ncbi:MAG: mannose-1-phosphate guanylyltransferase [Bacteroidales bacterium]|nr:mannose-1-phosphate guanylyltransferase [Bacteroidales bacterium]MBN2764204.1 mannose-1-phosphate guanylyltransferase [Bacteroidales bacterium]